MKKSELKQLLKEACREVFQEEMKDILLEAVRNPSPVIAESKAVDTEKAAQEKASIRENLRNMGMGMDGTMNFDSSMVKPKFNPAGAMPGGDLPQGDLGMDQIMNLMNK